MLIDRGKEKTPIGFGFTRPKVKVTWFTFVKKWFDWSYSEDIH